MRRFVVLLLALGLTGCPDTDPPVDDDDTTESPLDDDDAADDDDATAPVRPFISQSRGAVRSSANYQLELTVSAPEPAADLSSPTYRLRLGPSAVRSAP